MLNFIKNVSSQESCVPIQISFSLASSNDNGWSYPECLRATVKRDDPLEVKPTDFFDGAPETSLEWTKKGASLIGLNKTTAICQYQMGEEGKLRYFYG
jgi:hypothetical protein